jgi:hypothetical protein
MRSLSVVLLFLSGLVLTTCEKDRTEYDFEAIVLYRGLDCGDTWVIGLTNLNGDPEISESNYYADNLPEEFKIEGLEIKLDCRLPENDEYYACTTLGPAFPHIVVTGCEKR